MMSIRPLPRLASPSRATPSHASPRPALFRGFGNKKGTSCESRWPLASSWQTRIPTSDTHKKCLSVFASGLPVRYGFFFIAVKLL
jgi:hypothetical protein